MSDPFIQYPYIQKLMKQHQKCLNSGSRQIVLSQNEAGLLIGDISRLCLSHAENTKAIDTITKILMSMVDGEETF